MMHSMIRMGLFLLMSRDHLPVNPRHQILHLPFVVCYFVSANLQTHDNKSRGLSSILVTDTIELRRSLLSFILAVLA